MKRITIIVTVTALAVVLGWDVYVAIQGDWTATTSAFVYDLMKAHPMFPFALGVVIGHLVWPIQKVQQ